MGQLHPIETRANDNPGHLHQALARFNQQRLRPHNGQIGWEGELEREFALRTMELRFIEEQRAAMAGLLREVPNEAEAFMEWFEGLRHNGPGQVDPLFPWLADKADMRSMTWFLQQEVAGEAGFDDLVALTQVRLPTRAKLEMARNYWDEMGRGHEKGMHGPMLERLAHTLGIKPQIEDTVWEALALANLMVGLAANRRYAWQAIGALGVIEMTAPGRVSQVNKGLARLGVSAPARRYFQLHAGLDIRHSEAWNREIIHPLVEQDPRLARPIAEGALLRLQAGARCFQRYRTCLMPDSTVHMARSVRVIPHIAPGLERGVVAL